MFRRMVIMQKILDKFIEKLKTTFDGRLSSVFLYGSCAVEDCSREFNDINLVVIVNDLCAEDLKKAHLFTKDFAKKSKSLPIFMNKQEWLNSCDVYPIEYSDIKERYKIVLGENLIEGLKIDKMHLRLQCESELKNVLIRLRQTYLANSSDKNALKKLIIASSKSLVVLYRTVLRLLGEAVPTLHADVINLFCEKIQGGENGFDCSLFLKIIEFKKNSNLIKSSEYESVVQKLIDSTNYVLKYVDELEK